MARENPPPSLKMPMHPPGVSRVAQDSVPLKLPALTGPFKHIGFLDIEFNDSLYARLYYPSVDVPSQAKQAPWIPSSPYYSSYGDFIGIPWVVSQVVSRFLLSSARIPAYEGLEPSREQLPSSPLIVMSHGLGAFRTTYSAVCTQLASHGYLVAAIEHRDGSASLTLTDKHTVVMPYEHPKAVSPYDARQFSDKKMARAIGEHEWRNGQLLQAGGRNEAIALHFAPRTGLGVVESHGGEAQRNCKASLGLGGQGPCLCSRTLFRCMHCNADLLPGFQIPGLHRLGSLDVSPCQTTISGWSDLFPFSSSILIPFNGLRICTPCEPWSTESSICVKTPGAL